MTEEELKELEGLTTLEVCMAITDELEADDFVTLILRFAHSGACRFKDTKEIMRFIVSKLNVFTETEPQFKEMTQRVKATLEKMGIEEK